MKELKRRKEDEENLNEEKKKKIKTEQREIALTIPKASDIKKKKKKKKSRADASVYDETVPKSQDYGGPSGLERKGSKKIKENKEGKETEDTKGIKVTKKIKKIKEIKETKETKKTREIKETKETKEAKETEEAKEIKKSKKSRKSKKNKDENIKITDEAGPWEVQPESDNSLQLATMMPDTPISKRKKTRTELASGNPLHKRWYGPKELSALEAKGIVVRKGKWSLPEDQLLQSTLALYKEEHNLDDAAIQAIVFNRRKHNDFWSYIAAPFEDRSLRSIYFHVKQCIHPDRNRGTWTAEDDSLLQELSTKYPNQWKKIGLQLGRTGPACKDRWRDHIQHQSHMLAGKWTLAEEKKLKSIVDGLMKECNLTSQADIPWESVVNRMGKSRSRTQCRTKWYLAMSTEAKGSPKPKWEVEDDCILIKRINDAGYKHESEIIWPQLIGEDWKDWTTKRLRNRFNAIKKQVPKWDTIDFKELLKGLTELYENEYISISDMEEDD